MNTESKVLDIGCGCLRIGIKLINFLDKECYYGIEPNKFMLDTGIKHLLNGTANNTKDPSFSNTASFQLDDFQVDKFDYFIARSIWTHASKEQIIAMLDLFESSSTVGAKFFASIVKNNPKNFDYKGSTWVGKSHEKNSQSGIVHHSMKWITEQCDLRSFDVQMIVKSELNFGDQVWLQIQKK